MDYTINLEYAKLMPKLTDEEYEALKQSIKDDGQFYPIIVNGENTILDGHHRYRACTELGIEPKVSVTIFKDKLLEKKFVIEANLKRRQLNDFQRAEFGMALLDIESQLALLREKAGTQAPIGATVGKASQIVAPQIGLSRNTFERAKVISLQAPEKTKELLREGKLSISGVYENIQLTETLTKEKQGVIAPKLSEIKSEMRKENLTQDEKKRVVEKLATQEMKGTIENVDIARAVKSEKVESLTKDKSIEVQNKAREIVEQKNQSGIKTQAYEIVREAEETIRMESLIPTKPIEQQVKDMYASVDPNAVVENMSKIAHGMTQKDFVKLIQSIISKNHMRCPKCGELKIKWKCGHDFE